MTTELLAERYILEEEVARGGMATVWRARDEILARTVAVKVLHQRLSNDATFLARFRREALAAARLAHPNILAIYDTGEQPGDEGVAHYMVMEYCGGGTLAGLLQREGPMEPERVVAVGAAVCDALDCAHRQDVIHRDVKPGNILLTGDGTLKVADFGIARAVESADVTTTGTILGTVAYISPEHAREGEVDARSDLYSLGVVLFELVVGRPPFREESHVATALKHMNDPPPSPRSLRAGVPRALESVILQALEKDPDRRFSSAAEMKMALLGGRSVQTAVVPRVRAADAEELAQPTRTAPSLVPIAVLVALAVGAAVILGAIFTDEPGRSRAPRSGDGRDRGGIVRVDDVISFDPPPGDGIEHEEDAQAATDGDVASVWTTESYSAPISAQKDGVGLLFDLGDALEIGRVQVDGDPGTYSIFYAAELGDALDDFEPAQTDTSGPSRIELTDPIAARYWLLWITDLPGGVGRATVSEVTFFGPG